MSVVHVDIYVYIVSFENLWRLAARCWRWVESVTGSIVTGLGLGATYADTP